MPGTDAAPAPASTHETTHAPSPHLTGPFAATPPTARTARTAPASTPDTAAHGAQAPGGHAAAAFAGAAADASVPGAQAPHAAAEPGGDDRTQGDADVWAELCERFCLQFLVLAEKMRPAMDLLEQQEEDPDRLDALYEIDHGVTRMRRVARDLRVLADRGDEDVSGADTSLLDVVRMAASSIEGYRQVSIRRMVDLAVPAHAVEDAASLVAALLDNATRFSPAQVTVSAHLLDDGGVMLRIEDSGIGMPAAQLDRLNATLAGPVPAMTRETARQTGFPVVHRLARRHGVTVRFAARAGGTIALVTVPAALLCEVPAPEARTGGTGGTPPAANLTMARRAERPVRAATGPVAAGDTDLGGLPRRQRTSLRPVAAPESAPEPAPERPSGDPDGPGTFAADLDAFTAGTRRFADEQQEGRP
ncbi:sensor histidine kinase [Actinomadura sp. LOL_016]|uniref:sensor histidine kinase n=1 Tax=unclassified Actinomadura TaxID=2626254 RepID=UPI003A8035F6